MARRVPCVVGVRQVRVRLMPRAARDDAEVTAKFPSELGTDRTTLGRHRFDPEAHP